MTWLEILDTVFLVGLILFLSPFIVYILTKVATFAALTAKAEFKDKEEANGDEQKE